MAQLIVFPGGSSPYLECNSAPYRLLEEAACAHKFAFRQLDYVGNGHYPDIGTGFRLTAAVENVGAQLKRTQGEFTVFARCLGCYVAANLAHSKPGIFSECQRVIFWAPPSNWHIWRLLSIKHDSISEFNDSVAGEKGFRLSSDFLYELPPLEFLLTQTSFNSFEFACGENDESCPPSYLMHLQDLVRSENPDVSANVHVIRGAGHVVSPTSSEDVQQCFLKMIFDD